MQRHRSWLGVVSAAIVSVSSAGHAALSGASNAHVSFDASGPAGMKITGVTPELSVADDGSSLVIVVQLTNLSTGIGLRDQHMKEKYLETGKYPSTTLVIPRSALKTPSTGDKIEADVQGTLQLHGQSRPVTVHYDAQVDGTSLMAHGAIRLNMNDYGISVPSYLGVTVKPDVDVHASFRVAGN
jgi:polyisoprenoid-binding protein YceI